MTEREREILRWIEADPMISQQELADRAGITRSSVAVHISNLMKKGCISGRGYIVRGGDYAAVVGGVNVDIGGTASQKLVSGDSNPGRVRTSLGGVGRNIAHNMALLGVDTRLVTVFGDDPNAERLTESCRRLGIDVSGSLRVPGAATSTYLYIAGPGGDMALAVSDMEIYDRLTPEVMASRLDIVNNARALVLDTNIPENTIEWLCAGTHTPIFADPVSTVKAEKLRGLLRYLHTLKPNRLEAEILSGLKITDERSLHRAEDRLLEEGVQRLFISLGARGVLAADQEERFLLPSLPEKVVNTTGCGDAFMAGLVWSFLQGDSLRESACSGMAAAHVALESSETVNPFLSAAELDRRRKSFS